MALWVPVLETPYAVFSERLGLGGDDRPTGVFGLERSGRVSMNVSRLTAFNVRGISVTVGVIMTGGGVG